MTQEDKVVIRKIITTLQRIDNGENVFFNIPFYKKQGLITVKKKWGENPQGNKIEIGNTFHLTDKARRYLNVVI